MKFFGVDQTAARILVQGFLPQTIEWPSNVVIEQLDGGAPLSFAKILAGAAAASTLMFASAQNTGQNVASVSCALPASLIAQDITTCKPIDFAALQEWENDLALSGIPVVPSKDEFGRTIRTWIINPNETDVATLKWACNETDFAQLATQPAFGLQGTKDIFSFVQGCAKIVPIPKNATYVPASTAAVAIRTILEDKLEEVSPIKSDVLNATPEELFKKSAAQATSLAVTQGSQQFIEMVADKTGLSYVDASLASDQFFATWAQFRYAQPTTANLVLTFFGLFMAQRLMPVKSAIDQVAQLTQRANEEMPQPKGLENQEELSAKVEDLTVEVQLLRDINKGLLRDANEQVAASQLQDEVGVLRIQKQELETQVAVARDKALAAIQEVQDSSDAKIADIQLEQAAQLEALRQETARVQSELEAARLAQVAELQSARLTQVAELESARLAQIAELESLREKSEAARVEQANLMSAVTEAKNTVAAEVALVREARQTRQAVIETQTSPTGIALGIQTSPVPLPFVKVGNLSVQTSPDPRIALLESENAIAQARIVELEQRQPEQPEEDIFVAKPLTNTLMVHGIAQKVPKKVPASLAEQRMLLLKLNDNSLQNRILWATSGKSQNDLQRYFKGAKQQKASLA